MHLKKILARRGGTKDLNRSLISNRGSNNSSEFSDTSFNIGGIPYHASDPKWPTPPPSIKYSNPSSANSSLSWDPQNNTSFLDPLGVRKAFYQEHPSELNSTNWSGNSFKPIRSSTPIQSTRTTNPNSLQMNTTVFPNINDRIGNNNHYKYPNLKFGSMTTTSTPKKIISQGPTQINDSIKPIRSSFFNKIKGFFGNKFASIGRLFGRGNKRRIKRLHRR